MFRLLWNVKILTHHKPHSYSFNSVSIVTRVRAGKTAILGSAPRISLLFSVQACFWDHLASYPKGTKGLIPGGKAAEA
jgi:hypothetical protein